MNRQLGDESGYSLMELLIVMAILSVIVGGLTTLFVQGSNAENDLNSRYQAQSAARLALDKLRREIHSACSATTSGTQTGSYYSTVALVFSPNCAAGTATVTWCTSGSGSRYGLYRVAAATCASPTATFADYLTVPGIFKVTAPSATTHSLATLGVDIPVNPKPTKSTQTYELKDDIVLRNSTRQ